MEKYRAFTILGFPPVHLQGLPQARILPGLTLAAGVPGWQYNLLPPLMDGNPGTVFL